MYLQDFSLENFEQIFRHLSRYRILSHHGRNISKVVFLTRVALVVPTNLRELKIIEKKMYIVLTNEANV